MADLLLIMIFGIMSKIKFFNSEGRAYIRNRNSLKKHLESIFRQEKKNLDSLNYIFCSDKELLKINTLYLKHDFYTDIITFDLSESKNKILAEAYISIDRVKDNAKIQNTSYYAELYRVMIHGILHLCGYKDKSKREKEIIRGKEQYYLSQIFK